MNAQDFRSLQEAYSQVYELDEAVKGQDSDLRRVASSERQTEKAAHSKWKKSSPGTKKKPRFSSVPNTDTTASGYADQQSQEISWHDKKTKGKFIHGMSRNEEVDLYDIILSHLLDEGYAETPEAAEVIMVNMSEEWRESICDEVLDEKTASPAPRYNVRNRLDANKRRLRRSSDFYTYGGENQDPEERTISTSKGEGGITKNPKKLRKQQIMGEH